MPDLAILDSNGLRLGRVGMRHVNLHALDRAYSIAFPRATPINVNKKRSKK